MARVSSRLAKFVQAVLIAVATFSVGLMNIAVSPTVFSSSSSSTTTDFFPVTAVLAANNMSSSSSSLLLNNTSPQAVKSLLNNASSNRTNMINTFHMENNTKSSGGAAAATTRTTRRGKKFRKTATRTSTTKETKPKQQNKIPRRLIFTYKTNILETKRPNKTHANVLQLINAYKNAWKNNNNNSDDENELVEIWFLNDTECRSILQQVQPKLVKFYDKEPKGMFRGDMCRIAALLRKGGYYLDVDLQVIEPLILPDKVMFSTVQTVSNRRRFFQAFLAATPNHPILIKSLDYMVEYYQQDKGKKDAKLLMGPHTLGEAYASVQKDLPSESVVFFEEVHLGYHLERYPELPRQPGQGCCCDYVIHDPKLQKAHFYSRFLGASKRCAPVCPNNNNNNENNNSNNSTTINATTTTATAASTDCNYEFDEE